MALAVTGKFLETCLNCLRDALTQELNVSEIILFDLGILVGGKLKVFVVSSCNKNLKLTQFSKYFNKSEFYINQA